MDLMKNELIKGLFLEKSAFGLNKSFYFKRDDDGGGSDRDREEKHYSQFDGRTAREEAERREAQEKQQERELQEKHEQRDRESFEEKQRRQEQQARDRAAENARVAKAQAEQRARQEAAQKAAQQKAQQEAAQKAAQAKAQAEAAAKAKAQQQLPSPSLDQVDQDVNKQIDQQLAGAQRVETRIPSSERDRGVEGGRDETPKTVPRQNPTLVLKDPTVKSPVLDRTGQPTLQNPEGKIGASQEEVSGKPDQTPQQDRQKSFQERYAEAQTAEEKAKLAQQEIEIRTARANRDQANIDEKQRRYAGMTDEERKDEQAKEAEKVKQEGYAYRYALEQQMKNTGSDKVVPKTIEQLVASGQLTKEQGEVLKETLGGSYTGEGEISTTQDLVDHRIIDPKQGEEIEQGYKNYVDKIEKGDGSNTQPKATPRDSDNKRQQPKTEEKPLENPNVAPVDKDPEILNTLAGDQRALSVEQGTFGQGLAGRYGSLTGEQMNQLAQALKR